MEPTGNAQALTFRGITGRNDLPALPRWGVHRAGVAAADADVTVGLGAGVVAHGWNKVWLDAAFIAAGTKTATLRIWFWSEAASVDSDGVYTPGWVVQDVIADVAIDAGDAGHKQVLLEVTGRSFFVEVTALGVGATLHLLVAGVERFGD